MIGHEAHEPTKSKNRRMFSVEEDRIILTHIQRSGKISFPEIASFLPGRTTRQVRDRYKSYLKPEITNKPWSREEDHLLIQKHTELGPRWSQIQNFFPNRSTVNIKNRWASIGKHHKDHKENSFPPTVSVINQSSPYGEWNYEDFFQNTESPGHIWNRDIDSWI